MDIFSKEIPIFKSIFNGDIDIETEKELSLPDYCSDITRLIRVDVTPYIENCTAVGNKCTVNGTYLLTVLYESDYNSALSYTTFSVNFSENIDIKDAGSESKVRAKMNVRRIGCKMINPRKFIIRVKSALALSVKSIERKQITDTSALPENVFVKKEVLKWEETGEKKIYEFQFKESYNLSEKSEPIDDVVMNSFHAEKPEYSISDGIINLKTSVECKLLYSSESDVSKYIMSTKQIPVNMVIDDMNVEDGVSLDAEVKVSSSEISVDVDSYGENRVVEAAFTVEVSMMTKENVTVEYATDAFTAGIVSTPEILQFNTLAEGEKISRVFSAETRLTPERMRFTEICDHSVRISECKLKSDENGTVLKGTYTVSVLGMTENGYESGDFSDTFEEKISADKISFDICDVQCQIFESNTLLSSDGSIDVRVMCRADINTESYLTFSAVTGIRTAEQGETESSILIFCFPADDDNLWSIAKKYYADPNSITSDNPEAFDTSGNIVSKGPVRIIK